MPISTVNSGFGTESTSASENLAQNWWLFLLRGILGILFGVVALIFPGPTMLSLVLLFSAYTLVDGAAGIISAVRAIQRKEERWGWLIFEGAVNIAVAILAFLWPGMTVLAFVLLVAAWSIVSGALMTAAAFRLSVSHGRWWLVLGGLLSVGYGALLVATPLIGAIVLTWWMGAYAIAFGFALVILSFKLRLRQNQQINRTVARTAA
ncbi:HdeD family acid-resistance protein [Bradyrhizobium sp. BR 1433]|uniref:HdeD family acid-resistance protein n=1 Tax=Bradyrhizobium sp. BR 1433 TaxID=3447967 RepID=UPI003EE513B4